VIKRLFTVEFQNSRTTLKMCQINKDATKCATQHKVILMNAPWRTFVQEILQETAPETSSRS